MVGALILAAGLGRRIGMGPKALLMDDGMTFLERAVHTCRDGGVKPIRIVVRSGTPTLQRLAGSLGDAVVTNMDPERGMFSTVQCGFKDVDLEGMKGFVVYPVDHPRVRATTVADIASEMVKDGWIVPRFEGRPGHPIGIGAEIIRLLPDLPDWLTLREALEHAKAKRIHVNVMDSGILENVNTL